MRDHAYQGHIDKIEREAVRARGFSYIKAFEDRVVSGLADKIKAGIDVSTYPQYRDMNEMFLSMIQGLTKTPKGYLVSGKLNVYPGKMIPEVYAVRSHLGEVSEASGVADVRLKICVTGPYTRSTGKRVVLMRDSSDVRADLQKITIDLDLVMCQRALPCPVIGVKWF